MKRPFAPLTVVLLVLPLALGLSGCSLERGRRLHEPAEAAQGTPTRVQVLPSPAVSFEPGQEPADAPLDPTLVQSAAPSPTAILPPAEAQQAPAELDELDTLLDELDQLLGETDTNIEIP